jgi:hypothetical protein
VVRSGSGIISRDNSGIRLLGQKKSAKNLSQDSRSPGRDLNRGPPGHEAGVLTLDHDVRSTVLRKLQNNSTYQASE